MLHLLQSFFLESLGVLAVLVLGPAIMVWLPPTQFQPRRIAILALLALGFASAGAAALLSLGEGQGMFGLLLAIAGLLLAAVAVVFVSAAASSALGLILTSQQVNRPSVSSRAHVPLSEEHRKWQRDSGRPNANYEKFLHEAHPRRFPISAGAAIAAVVAMAIAFALLLKR